MQLNPSIHSHMLGFDAIRIQVLFPSNAIELLSQHPINPRSPSSGSIMVYPGGFLHLVQFSKCVPIHSAQLG